MRPLQAPVSPRLVLTLVTSVLVGGGCAANGPDADGEDCLPGDIECAAPGAHGKEDGFDHTNDPARMSQKLTYRLADLPRSGELKTPIWKAQFPDAVGHVPAAWADTYWPTNEGSHNARWQGPTVKSPLEKYDAAFNSAPGCATYPQAQCGAGITAEWDKYFLCAGPAAAWQSTVYQGSSDMHDGRDNNGDGKKDECFGDKDTDGIPGWWGTCHAWTPASLLIPEPQHAVTMNGQTFEVADIKALAQNIFDSTSAVMLGGRCNAMEITHDVKASANDACRDVNPGALHVVLTNFIGLAQLPLIEDRRANLEVWNQPIVKYDVTKQRRVTASAANRCVGQTGSTWSYNTNARELYEVETTVTYVVEGAASRRPIGMADNLSTDTFHYVLEVGATGKVLGGRFCTDSEDSHIDYLWSPTGRHDPSNPHVNVARVQELIAKSITPSTGGTGAAKVFTATPTQASIPDHDPTGVTVDVPVAGVTGSPGLTISVDITHPHVGDLVLTLEKDGTKVKVLRGDLGGAAANIVESYNLSAAQIGSSPNGRWSLRVVDDAAQDIGKVNSVTLSFE